MVKAKSTFLILILCVVYEGGGKNLSEEEQVHPDSSHDVPSPVFNQ